MQICAHPHALNLVARCAVAAMPSGVKLQSTQAVRTQFRKWRAKRASSFSHVTTIEEVAAAAPVGPGSAETELALVLREVPGGGVCAGGVEPFDLTQALARGSQVGEVQRARLVVVGQVTELPAVGRPLDDGERRVRQAVDPGAAPLLRRRRRGAEHRREREEGQRRPSCAHHITNSSMARAPRNAMSRNSDTCTNRLAVGEAAPDSAADWRGSPTAGDTNTRADPRGAVRIGRTDRDATRALLEA